MKIIITILLFTISTGLFGQNAQLNYNNCDIEIIKDLRFSQEKLTTQRLSKFLKSYKEECKSNPEYSQAANWNLFYFLKENTELTLMTIEELKDSPDFELEWIIEQFSEPVSDDINVELVYNSVKEINPKTETHNRILNKLKSAIPKEHQD